MMSVILESAARTLLLTAAVWTTLRVLRVGNVIAQKIAWTLVLAAAIAMPFLMRSRLIQVNPVAVPTPAILNSTILNSWTSPVHRDLPAASVASAIPAPEEAKEPVTSTESLAPATFEIAPAVAATPAPVRRWTLPALGTLVVRIYLVVSGFLLLRLLTGLALAWRIWRRAEPASVLVEPHADVRFSSDITTPVTIGVGIVLPASFQEWHRPRLRIVLAHELAHVRQRDFYLQLFAHLHTAIFWFSPAAWWIQKHLSDLGEAISDFAGITEAKDAPSYAELLLEVASMPRRPIFAVAMARSSRIEHRIDRLLVDRIFRRSFVEGKGRALAVAAIVPLVLTASASLIAVRAAEKMTPMAAAPLMHVVAQEAGTSLAVPEASPVPPTTAVAPLSPANPAPSSASALPAAAPAFPAPPLPNVRLASADSSQANPPAVTVEHDPDTNYSNSDQDSFMIVNGDKSQTFNFHGDYSQMEAIRKKLHGNYILAERDGKYYVIDDPAMMDQSRKLFAPIEELGRQQEALGAQQEKLGEEQDRLGKQQEEAHIETPDMSKEIAELQAAVKKLQDLQKSKTVTGEELAEVQSRIGGIEGHLGAMEGQIGAQQGDLGRQQGELGRQQGELGRQQGELGRQQGRLARQASRQMESMIDQAVQSGKAKPVQ